jgi:uncharacterized protein
MRSLDIDLHRLGEERSAAVESIAPKELELYEKLRMEKRGVAVAMIEDKCCSACGSTLSSGQIQAARAPNSITPCPSCGRILYGG